MPTFDTPEPITVTFHVEVGAVHLAAEDRRDTVVEVRPHSDADPVDAKAAEQTRVTYADGELQIRSGRGRPLFGRPGAVAVRITLPEGSQVHGTTSLVDVSAQGRLGECRLKTAVGHIRLDEAGPVRLTTQHGNIGVARVTGDAEIGSGIGEVRIGTLAGAGEIKSTQGDVRVAEAAGALRLKVANGNIRIGRALAGVAATSARGNARVDQAVRGTVELETRSGDLEVGIPEGTAAWLDIDSRLGNVRTTLDAAEGPGDEAATVEVRARTGIGDILVRRPTGA
jgi:hypothetical protein